MRFALMIEPQQGLSYGDQLAIAKRAEANGFEALFRSDHYQSFPGPAGQPDDRRLGRPRRPCPRHRRGSGSGVLVSPVTFRHPGNLAKVVTTVDEMSGGRIEVGRRRRLERRSSTRQLGLPFPQIAERADLLEDQLAILHGLWGEPDGWSYDGPARPRSRTRSSTRSRSTSRPAAAPIGGARPRILVGGEGSPRSYADRRPLRRRVQPRRRRRRTRRRDEVRGSSTRRARRSAATRRRSPTRRWSGVLIGRDEDEVRRAAARRCCRRSATGDDERGVARGAARALDLRARPTRPGRRSRRFAEAGVGADHAPGLPAVGPRHDRPHGRGACSGVVERGRARQARSAADGRARSAGRRGGSGRGSCRGRERAARSELERRRPCRAAPRPARAGPAPRDRRSAGRPASARRGSRARGVGADDRRGPRCPGPRPPASAWRARSSRASRASRSVRIRTSAGRGIDRRQVAVQERLEVAHRRREPRRLLDLEHELAGGRPVGARRRPRAACVASAIAAAIARRARAAGAGCVRRLVPPASSAATPASVDRPAERAPRPTAAATIGDR